MNNLSFFSRILPIPALALLIACGNPASHKDSDHDHGGDAHGHGHDHDHDHDAESTFRIQDTQGQAPRVFASNYPLRFFTERIGGDLIEIVYPVPADEDPAYWTPSPEDVRAIQSADILFLNGATYEKWAETVTLREDRIVNTSAGFSHRYIKLQDAVVHSHGPGEEHSHAGTAFNTWLNPQHAAAQANVIYETLAAQLPDHGSELLQNHEVLREELEALDKRFGQAIADHENTTILASHPVYDYFAERYSLDIVSLHWEPDEFPSIEQWIEFAEIHADNPTDWMIWEDVPADKTQARLREEGVDWIVFRTAMNTPEEMDYIAIMNENANNLLEIFE